MSLPKKMTVKCSKCGADIEVTVFESVNTDYAPDITEQIISGELFNAKCHKCGFVSHLEYDILYHDVKHGAMIWVLHDNSPEYASKVEELRSSANILGYKTTRIVNNMNELRQKVACLENGRDDRIIELCKVFITYNLLSKQPDFEFNNAFYTNFLDQERVFLYDKNGEELSCELTDDAYSLLCDMYYNSKYAASFEDYYALVDYDWAESIIQPLLQQEAEKIDAKNAAKDAPADTPTVAEKKLVCPQCKQALPDDSVFCHYCGTAITKQPPIHNVPKSNTPKEVPKYNHPTTTAYSSYHTYSEQPTNKKKGSRKVLIALLIIGAIALIAVLGVAIGIPEYKYSQACELLDDGLYFKAIEAFEELDGYKDSDDKIKEAKYEYVLDNKNNNNSTTYEYLSELKRVDYKNSADIYDDLYEWRVTVIAVNSSEEDETTNKTSISRSSSIYFHIRLTGGKPNDSMRITVKPHYPDGDTSEYTFDDEWTDGETGWYGWYDGLYEYPEYGATGTLQCKFYDESGNLIGSGSVRISN